MKEGWEYSTIGKICKTYSGGTPLKNVKEYYQNGNIPWLRSGEVCKKYIFETELFITQKGLENSSAISKVFGVRSTSVTVTSHEALSPLSVVAVILVLPGETPVTNPFWSTLAIELLSEDQESVGFASVGCNVAWRVMLEYTSTLCVEGREIDVGATGSLTLTVQVASGPMFCFRVIVVVPT